MFSSQLFLLYVIGIMIITGIVKKHNLFSNVYSWLYSYIKSKRFFVFLYSALGGILPIPGRCVISASLLDTIVTKNKKQREKFGIIDYLSTHHYYFWSPLEKTIIIPMGVLGLTYWGILSYLWPLLLTYLLFLFCYLFFSVKESDIQFSLLETNKPLFHIVPLLIGIGLLFTSIAPWTVFSILPLYYIIVTKTFNLKELYSFINIKLLIFLSITLFAGYFSLLYLSPLVHLINTKSFILVSLFSFLLAFALGSSSKFASMVSILTSIFGLQYLPYFFSLDFFGYLLSPTHKCLIISKEYFNTNLRTFYTILIFLGILILTVGILLVV